MATLMIVLLFILGILAAVVSSLCVDECKAWLTWLVNFVIERAVRRLPDASRERYAEEWHGHVNEVPGTIGKLVAALSLLRAARKMSPALAEHSVRIQRKDATDWVERQFLGILINCDIQKKTDQLLARLSPLEEQITRTVFGIEVGRGIEIERHHTAEEIAEKFATTPEQVSAILMLAMRKLVSRSIIWSPRQFYRHSLQWFRCWSLFNG